MPSQSHNCRICVASFTSMVYLDPIGIMNASPTPCRARSTDILLALLPLCHLRVQLTECENRIREEMCTCRRATLNREPRTPGRGLQNWSVCSQCHRETASRF